MSINKSENNGLTKEFYETFWDELNEPNICLLKKCFIKKV